MEEKILLPFAKAKGMYAACDALAGEEAEEVMTRLQAQPRVPVAPHYDGPLLKKRRE